MKFTGTADEATALAVQRALSAGMSYVQLDGVVAGLDGVPERWYGFFTTRPDLADAVKSAVEGVAPMIVSLDDDA